TRAGEFRATLEIQDAKLLAQFPMRLGRKVKLWRSTPTPCLDIVVGALPYRNRIVRKIGHTFQDGLELVVGFADPLFIVLDYGLLARDGVCQFGQFLLLIGRETALLLGLLQSPDFGRQ